MAKGTAAKDAKPKPVKKPKKEESVRDNFKQPVKNQLQKICGGICSNPDCRVTTFGPTQENRQGFSSIGVAAHITAAAPGPGARRYDPEMTEAVRVSEFNGIWLCQSCSKLIDTDEVRFTVALLHEWKREAIKRALDLIGKASVAPGELQNKLIEAVATATQLAYTGMGDYSRAPLAGFVAGFENYLSQLDPRFEIKTTATGKHVSHEIKVKPGHDAKINIVFKDDSVAKIANARWKNFLETGESIEISTNDFEFVGSALFEKLTKNMQSGVLSLEPQKSVVPSTLYFKSLKHDLEFELASFDAYLHVAGENLYIAGECLNGLLSFKYKYNSETLKVTIDYNFNPEVWIFSRFANLEHLPKLLKAVNFLKRDVESRMVIEFNLDGNMLPFGENTDHDLMPLYEFFAHFVQLVDRAKTIALAIDKDLKLLSLDVSEHDERLINIYSEILRGNLTQKEPMGKEIVTAHMLKVDDKTVEQMNSHGLASYLKISERCGEDFNLFGNMVTPPVFQSELKGFEAAFYTDLDSVIGDELGLKIYAIEGSTITHSIAKTKFKINKTKVE